MTVQSTKRLSDRQNAKKVRTVDFGDTLTTILKKQRKEQLKTRCSTGNCTHRNYYKEVQDKNRVYYEYYSLEKHAGYSGGLQRNLICMFKTGRLPWNAEYIEYRMPDACKETGRVWGLSLPPAPPYLYKQSAVKRCSAERRAGTLGTLWRVVPQWMCMPMPQGKAKRTSARLLDKVAGND